MNNDFEVFRVKNKFLIISDTSLSEREKNVAQILQRMEGEYWVVVTKVKEFKLCAAKLSCSSYT